MHLLFLGATGRTGTYAYKYALEQGHYVTAVLRNASALAPHDNLNIIQGSVLSNEVIDSALASAHTPIDAAVLFLNHSGNHCPPRLMADATRNVARALRLQQSHTSGIKCRLVVMSAIGAGETRKVAPWLAKFLIDYHNATAKIYNDHDALDAEIEEYCGFDIRWTLVMAVGLRKSGLKPVRTFSPLESGASWFITRQSCAKWMVDVAAGEMGDEFSNQRVIVSN